MSPGIFFQFWFKNVKQHKGKSKSLNEIQMEDVVSIKYTGSSQVKPTSGLCCKAAVLVIQR